MKRLSSKQYARRLWDTWSETPVERRPPLLTAFLRLLRRQRALKLAPRILEHLQQFEDTKNGVRRVRVETAGDVDEQALQDELQDIFGPVVLDIHFNSELLAGLKIQIGDQIFDGSIASQLRRLQTHLSNS